MASGLKNKNLKKFEADSYYDGRFGTQHGEQAQEARIVWAKGLKSAFKKAFGFIPSGKMEDGMGYRYVNEDGLSLSAECFRVRIIPLSIEEIEERYAE